MSANINAFPDRAAEQKGEIDDGHIFSKALKATMRKQRLQDFFFHKLTLLFALSVLFVLMGIIASLMIGAWPALKEFGLPFVTSIEWDPVNDKYGALIAIVGGKQGPG